MLAQLAVRKISRSPTSRSGRAEQVLRSSVHHSRLVCSGISSTRARQLVKSGSVDKLWLA